MELNFTQIRIQLRISIYPVKLLSLILIGIRFLDLDMSPNLLSLKQPKCSYISFFPSLTLGISNHLSFYVYFVFIVVSLKR